MNAEAWMAICLLISLFGVIIVCFTLIVTRKDKPESVIEPEQKDVRMLMCEGCIKRNQEISKLKQTIATLTNKARIASVYSSSMEYVENFSIEIDGKLMNELKQINTERKEDV